MSDHSISGNNAAPVDRSKSFTFMGLLDDQVEQFPFQSSVDAKYIYASLIKSVFFSGPLLIPDGFLLQHTLCREALFGSSSHPLRVLIDEGYLGILSTDQDLEASLRKRSEKGVKTISAALDALDAQQVKRVLRGLTRQLSERKQIFGWPTKDTGQCFWELMRSYRTRGPDDLGLHHLDLDTLNRIFDRFDEAMAQSTEAARTTWHDIAVDEIEKRTPNENRKPALVEAMRLANEAYHFNFATCLSPNFQQAIAVETRLSSNFDNLVDIPELDAERAVKIPQCPTPRIDLNSQGSLLKEFLLESYELHSLKKRFLLEQEAYILGLLDFQSLEATRDEYARKIGERFGLTSDMTRADAKLSWVLLTGTSVTSAAVDLSAATGTALSALALTTQQGAAPIIIRKMRARNITKDVLKYIDNVIFPETRRVAAKNAATSVQIYQKEARRIAKGLRDYS